MLTEILQKLLALTFSFGFGLSSLQVLHQTFPQHTFLMNGLIHGVKVRNIPSRISFKSAMGARRTSLIIYIICWYQLIFGQFEGALANLMQKEGHRHGAAYTADFTEQEGQRAACQRGAGVTTAVCFSWKYSQHEISPVPILWSVTE